MNAKTEKTFLENARAKIDTATTANFPSLLWALGELMTSPPIGFPTPAANSPELARCNVELANLLAQAVATPLIAIAKMGAGQKAAEETAKATTAFVAEPPAPGAASGVVGVAIGSVNSSHCQQEFIACATLILATAKAVCSVGIEESGLTPAAINAAAAAAMIADRGTLGGNFLTVSESTAVENAARELVRAYAGVGGNMAARPLNAAALQAVFNGKVDEAHDLLCHLVERGHFWRHAVRLPRALSPERHFLAWARGARSGLDTKVPDFHSAFVVPVATEPTATAAGTKNMPAGPMKDAVTHLHTLLAAANAAYSKSENTCLSWNGKTKNATNPKKKPLSVKQNFTTSPATTQGRVGIHLNVGAGGGAGTMIKCNLRAGGNLLATNLVRSPTSREELVQPSSETLVQQQMAEAATALGEAATTAELLGRLPASATNKAYLAPLGVSAIVAATPTANVATNRISFWVNRKGAITMFAE